MSNVVKMTVKSIPGNLEDIDHDYSRLVRAFINRLVREYVKNGGNIRNLALKAGVSPQTISRLAYYETTRPVWHTVMAVIHALYAMEEFADLTVRYAKRHPTSRDK
jgi:DNA-binding phage protein